MRTSQKFTNEEYGAIIQRIYTVSGARTQMDLAEILGVRQSSISDAIKRKAIPAGWLLTLLQLKKVNPDWIVTGSGGPFPSIPESKAVLPDTLTNDKTSLAKYPMDELVTEIVKRAINQGSFLLLLDIF